MYGLPASVVIENTSKSVSSDSSSENLKNCGLTVVLGVGVVTWVQWDRDDTKSEIVKQSFFRVSYGMGERRR